MQLTAGEESLAISANQLAELLGISKRHLWSLNAQGKLPRPVRLGRAVRWPLGEIREWIASGAPDRDVWEQERTC
ncbi:MAG: helix-turn-helix domain-containing protein [Pirellulales bacterium]|nr:helix-turn-helix domain-containing protein [Pirellulales bacterium]